MKTFKLNYKLKLTGCEIKTGTFKVKNCYTELQAKIKLHGYFEKQFKEIESIEISRAEDDGILDFLNCFKNTNVK